MPSQGVSKAVKRLEEGLANQEYYESQQVVKTVYWRYRTRKLLQDSYDLLIAASQAQLTNGQVCTVLAYTQPWHKMRCLLQDRMLLHLLIRLRVWQILASHAGL